MAQQRIEQLDERFARHLRESRARAIVDNNDSANPVIWASMAYEGWYDGDPAGTHPEPNTDHQPAFDEPLVNTSNDPNVWSALDPYWLRVPVDGLWSIELEPAANVSLNITTDAYRGVKLRTRAESWRGHDSGDPDLALFPEGRDDPFGVAGIWSGVESTHDLTYLPVGVDFVQWGQSVAGPPIFLTENDSIRVLFTGAELDTFDTGDGWFALDFQGLLTMRRIGGLVA